MKTKVKKLKLEDIPEIKPIGLIHTPASTQELMDYIKNLSGPERALGMVIMGMTWNLIASKINGKG